ncbi:MAG TPA: DUF1934 domain-containing protein [Oscillatoriaceae cyanobacterium]
MSSRQEDSGLAETTSQRHQGVWYERDDASYLIYDEEGLKTTLRIGPDEIRLYRRGELSGWQVFQLGEVTGGVVSLGGAPMTLRILTSHLALEQGGGSGRIALHYELWTAPSPEPDAVLDMSLGKFALELDWAITPGVEAPREPEFESDER